MADLQKAERDVLRALNNVKRARRYLQIGVTRCSKCDTEINGRPPGGVCIWCRGSELATALRELGVRDADDRASDFVMIQKRLASWRRSLEREIG